MMNEHTLARYRPWFYAAALYNLAWGVVNVLFPRLLFDLFGIEPPPAPYWQVVGMFVLVYAPAYWWAGHNPFRYRHFILIGLLGKLFGPAGFVLSAISGQLPLTFGWIILTNDLIWLPAFILFTRDVARATGGLLPLLRGE
jgi:small multidrug resistance pump